MTRQIARSDRLARSKKTVGLAVLGLICGYSPGSIAADPAIFLQSATVSGASDALTLTRVPVRNGAGTITYKDVSVLFSVNAAGVLTLASANITASPTLAVGAFKPGTYNGYPGDYGRTIFKVGSPGVGSGGRISGSIQRITTDFGWIFNANWTSGPVAGHPYQALLQQAGITSNALAWGVMGTAGSSTQSSGWNAGDIIGAVQTGNQLTLTNFGNDNIPDAALAFTLCPTADPC